MIAHRSASNHTPVLVSETLDALAVQPGGRYIDCTVGGGGHATAIMEKSSPGGQLLGIDADPKAIEISSEKLKKYGNSVVLVNDNFSNLQAICLKYDFSPVHGILFDLGLSSLQLNEKGRGSVCQAIFLDANVYSIYPAIWMRASSVTCRNFLSSMIS